MKNLKYLILSLGCFILTLIFCGFVLYMLQPKPPEAIQVMEGDNWDLESTFHEINPEFWSKADGKLTFYNQPSNIQLVSLHSNLLPSEHKKEGYIMSTVTVPQNFDEIADNSFFGFQLGEQGAPKEDCIFMGLNGKGEITVQNGTGKVLSQAKPKIKTSIGSSLYSKANGTIDLSFHYYENLEGWVLFFKVKGDEIETGAVVNHIPYEQLDSKNKTLSLVAYNALQARHVKQDKPLSSMAYNTSQKGSLWFKDWQIQNDWTPND